VPNFTGEAALAFKFMQSTIDRANAKYDDICERRREYAKRGAAVRWGKTRQGDECQKASYGSISEQSNTNDSKDAYPNRNPNRNPESSNEDINKKKKESKEKKKEVFDPPTLQEVEEYIKEKGYHTDAQRFIDVNESVGWMRNNTPIRNWKAALNAWVRTGVDELRPKAPQHSATGVTLGYGEFINDKGYRTYGDSGIRVPDDAPARPSGGHWWSKTTQQWEDAI
jgi:hypothetical protein